MPRHTFKSPRSTRHVYRTHALETRNILTLNPIYQTFWAEHLKLSLISKSKQQHFTKETRQFIMVSTYCSRCTCFREGWCYWLGINKTWTHVTNLMQWEVTWTHGTQYILNGAVGSIGGHLIAPKTTSANTASASPLPPNEKSRKRQSSYTLGWVKLG